MELLRAWLFSMAGLVLLVAGCGGGGGGGGSAGPEPEPVPVANNVTVSGVVKNVTAAPGLGRATYAEVPSVAEARVEVLADLDGDGRYSADERFETTSDADGTFAVLLPTGEPVANLTVKAGGFGYSEFLKTFENVEGPLRVVAALSEGDVAEIDVSGIAAGPARAGRVTLLGDEVVTLKLYGRSSVSGGRAARASLGRFAEGDDQGPPLVEVSFPLRGVRLAASSEKMYADMAYLDTVNDTATMPGGFQAEGQGETPVEILSTYAASQIRLYDESGNELMNDASARNTDVTIKIAIPPEAWPTLVDEDATTTDVVEVPFYYYDETAGTWVLHKTADGSSAYGTLVDSFGNVLTAADLVALQTPVYDAQGEATGSAYQPGGSGEWVLYQVGTVHHFTTWNCDRAGKSVSENFEVVDADGKPIPGLYRMLKMLGSYGDDIFQGNGTNPRLLGHVSNSAAAGAMANLMSTDDTIREAALDGIRGLTKPSLLQSYVDAIPGIIGSSKYTGLAASILNRSNDIAANDVANQVMEISCAEDPDNCRQLLISLSETVRKNGSVNDAVGVLTDAAAAQYDISKVTNIANAAQSALKIIHAATKVSGTNTKLGQLAGTVDTIMTLTDQIKSTYPTVPTSGSSGWAGYTSKMAELKTEFAKLKAETVKVSTAMGGRLNRAARAALARLLAAEPATPPENEEELAALEEEMRYDLEDLGGLFFNASRHSRIRWGVYQNDEFVPGDAPANVRGGAEVMQLQYFTGAGWEPLPGRSDSGIDASFVSVPSSTSFMDGSSARPVAHLGTWVMDRANTVVQAKGRLAGNDGNPLPGLAGRTCYLSGVPATIGADGSFSAETSGQGSLYNDKAEVALQLPGLVYTSRFVTDAVADFGTVSVADRILFEEPSGTPVTALRNETAVIDGTAYTLSGTESLTYTIAVYDRGRTKLVEQTGSSGRLVFDVGGELGSYFAYVTAGTASGKVANKAVSVAVVSATPTVEAIAITPSPATAGDTVQVVLTVEDSDVAAGYDEVITERVRMQCVAGTSSRSFYPVRDDTSGSLVWTFDTDVGSWAYTLPTEGAECTVTAFASDGRTTSAPATESFHLTRAESDPEVAYNRYGTSYAQAWALRVYPGNIRFSDRNGDIASYVLDCGQGAGEMTSTEPITDVDAAADGNQGCFYAEPKVDPTSGTVVPYTFTYTATDASGASATATSSVTIHQPVDLAVSFPGLTVTPDEYGRQVVELPAGAGQSASLALTSSSSNGDGTLSSLSYSLTRDWREYIAAGDLADPASGTVNVTLDRPGTYTVWASVTDNVGLTASMSETFYVTAPFDFELAVNGKSGQALDEYYFSDVALTFERVVTESPTGFAPSYRWQLRADGTADFVDLGGAANYTRTLPAGTHTVRLVLGNTADPTGLAVTRDLTLTVVDPLTPTIGTTYVSPVPADGAVALGDAYVLSAGATLPSGVTLESVHWAVTKADGSSAAGAFSFLDDGDATTASLLFTRAGQYAVSVTLTDSRGVSQSSSFGPFTVTEYPPEVTGLTPAAVTPQGPPLTVDFAAQARASTTAGMIARYVWTVTGESISGGITTYVDETRIQTAANTTDPAAFSHTFTMLGTYAVSVEVEDNLGRDSAPVTRSVVVAYASPTIDSITAAPSSGNPPLAVTFTAAAADADGTIVDYAWDFDGDGTADTSGAGIASTNHTYTQPGSYAATLTVTDSQGLTAEKSVTVLVRDPDAGVDFHFRQLRADGLGADFTFSTGGGEFHESVTSFASPGMVSTLDLPDATTGELSQATVAGASGWNGFYSDSWGTLTAYLVYLDTSGTYDVGLDDFMAAAPSVPVTVLASYTCGGFVTGDGVSWMDLDGSGQVSLELDRTKITVAGEVDVVALLGTGTASACESTWVGYAAGTTLGVTLSTGQSVVTLPVALPVGAQWSEVNFTVNGMNHRLTSYALSAFPVDGQGRLLVPVVPGADYELTYTDSSVMPMLTVTRKLGATELGGLTELDLSASVLARADVVLTNVPENGTLVLTQESTAWRVKTSASVAAGAGTFVAAGVVASPTKTDVQYAVQWGQEIFERFTGDALAAALDVGNLASGPAISNLDVQVDTVAKTATVALTSGGDLCLLKLYMSYSGHPGSRDYSLLARSADFPITVGVTLPDGADPYSGDPVAGTDAVQNVSVTAFCADTVAGYDASVTELLEHLRYTNWYRSNLTGLDLPTAWHQPYQVNWSAP